MHYFKGCYVPLSPWQATLILRNIAPPIFENLHNKTQPGLQRLPINFSCHMAHIIMSYDQYHMIIFKTSIKLQNIAALSIWLNPNLSPTSKILKEKFPTKNTTSPENLTQPRDMKRHSWFHTRLKLSWCSTTKLLKPHKGLQIGFTQRLAAGRVNKKTQ